MILAYCRNELRTGLPRRFFGPAGALPTRLVGSLLVHRRGFLPSEEEEERASSPACSHAYYGLWAIGSSQLSITHHRHSQVDQFSTVGGSYSQRTNFEQCKGVFVIMQNETIRQELWRILLEDLGHRSLSATAHLETTASGDETEQTCQLEFGSYCLWSVEYKEKMQDSLVKKMKDQLFVARSYYPSIAKLHSQEKLSLELRQNIQDHERMLSDALVDADLPINVEKKVHSMEVIIGRVKSFHLGCVNVNKKLQQILDLTEDEAHFHRRQSAFLYHLGVQTMSKSLHCLSLRLTVEYFNSPLFDMEDVHSERLANPALQHYVIFSSNILASAVAINSTVMNAKSEFLFMKMWFSRNVYKKALIHVTDIEDYYYFLNNSQLGMQPHLSLSEEFRISVRSVDQPSLVDRRTEYISTPSHAYFLLPDIFKNLKRIVVLDDAVVVQRKAIGAVEFCELRLGHLESYLGEEDYDKEACLWLFGLNVVDLDQWRNLNVTGTYQKLLSKSQETTHTSWRTAALPSSLLASQDLIYVLDDSWVLSGLGTNYAVSRDAIQKAAILHYNGNMKPWLELGIPQYKTYWRNYLTQQDQFMDECNVNR
ncbi:unnamed protein product [Spirodela intermedia]|uniref:Hexosyltransferase n=1 Tax=Spirodela intermedia TaxID=51605 RepID=A0A7I8IA40_SPIIN|nr:unnamed protein product [Spirodela intermedia]CAA6654545.1 unnamed protein product [Spirodela intermedia]